MYSLIRHLLFKLEPEASHFFALKSLAFAYQMGLIPFLFPTPIKKPVTVMGIHFDNPVGLAAGLDKNGDYIDALSSLGFGFIEIGTVTPKPQEGNPKPRIFRFAKEKALINRMGFPNKGADYVISRLEKMRYRGVLGINIGKNKTTPNENALDDYLIGLRKFYPYASYLVINLSSPNTEGLRDLQEKNLLSNLLSQLKLEQQNLKKIHNKYVPLVLKISPDLKEGQIEEVAHVCLDQKIDGIIATNTTLDRTTLASSETGGLSGLALQEKSTEVLSKFKEMIQDAIPLIASGGIMNAKAAHEKWQAGASLLEVYTGFIFEGPNLIHAILNDIK